MLSLSASQAIKCLRRGSILFLLIFFIPTPGNCETLTEPFAPPWARFSVKKTGIASISRPSRTTWIIETGADGQITLLASGGFQIRLKENSRLTCEEPLHLRLEKGLIGFRFPEKIRDLLIFFPFGRMQLCQGTIVAKLYPSMTRIGVLKGTLEVICPGENPRPLSSNQERGICSQEISEPYQTLEDLFFAWYWDKKKD